jgi:methyl-accepting chemotaxis protein
MDKVTQQNAAGAEEGASTSIEMNDQADQMKKYVEVLTHLVNGRGKGAGKNNAKAEASRSAVDARGNDSLPSDQKKPAVKTAEVSPQSPTAAMDDDDLDDF